MYYLPEDFLKNVSFNILQNTAKKLFKISNSTYRHRLLATSARLLNHWTQTPFPHRVSSMGRCRANRLTREDDGNNN
jgi:hypothetical protein